MPIQYQTIETATNPNTTATTKPIILLFERFFDLFRTQKSPDENTPLTGPKKTYNKLC